MWKVHCGRMPIGEDDSKQSANHFNKLEADGYSIKHVVTTAPEEGDTMRQSAIMCIIAHKE